MTEQLCDKWITVEKPGYLGKKKDEEIIRWNLQYGINNWRIVWELKNNAILNYSDIFWKFYVPGYTKYFLENINEALYLSENFSFAFDKDQITRSEAFNPHALFNIPGRPNQFHNVAINISLEYYIGLPFKGCEPIQVREGKPGTNTESWPKGWKWSPGRIPSVRQDLIPDNEIHGWWERGSIEDLYQTAKVLQIKN